ncbi:hypothetical protein GCM10009535_02280 [Streptomyces thermocarboxydovorans]|uniref:Uncharacterized protein n=1 Tax=Streptomyces thermocarboxydovorans TaxID=59298 RepID=A0ABN1H6I1_9ACTN
MDMKQHTVIDSPYGPLTLVADDGVLSGLYMTDQRHRPPEEIFGARADHADTPFAEAREQLSAYFAGDLTHFTLGLRPHGTPFQRRVWAELTRIPYGETRTYGQLAAALGNPKSSGGVLDQGGARPVVHADRLAVEQEVGAQVGLRVPGGFRLQGGQGAKGRLRGGGEGLVGDGDDVGEEVPELEQAVLAGRAQQPAGRCRTDPGGERVARALVTPAARRAVMGRHGGEVGGDQVGVVSGAGGRDGSVGEDAQGFGPGQVVARPCRGPAERRVLGQEPELPRDRRGENGAVGRVPGQQRIAEVRLRRVVGRQRL